MNEQVKTKEKEPESRTHKAFTIVGIVLCVILVPILILNCTLIVKSMINKEEAPSIFGVTPFIVLTDSMEPTINGGDIILVKDAKIEDIKPGDIVSFYDPASSQNSVTTHRVMYTVIEKGEIKLQTAGDGNILTHQGNEGKDVDYVMSLINNTTVNESYDKHLITSDELIGVWTDVRIPIAGNVAMFMQTPAGLIVCVLVPLLLILGYEILRRRKYDKKKTGDMAALMAELEALRAGQTAAPATPAEASAEAPVVSEEEKSEETT